ncbi:Plug domain-containing protein (plasmid) [Escherichia coli]|nr:Plug domain-containing protein [Escherichia coli]
MKKLIPTKKERQNSVRSAFLSGRRLSEQEALEKTGATSSRTTDKNLQSLDATVRSMPGTYTQIDPGQGAISVNIRGMSGFGRVNTMVDGITQSFYGTSTSGTTAHGSTNNMAGVLIDPNLLVAVDVTRGDSSGSEGINALLRVVQICVLLALTM